MFKKIFSGLLWGVGVTLGTVLVQEGIGITKDPYKKDKIKNKFTKIKDAIKN